MDSFPLNHLIFPVFHLQYDYFIALFRTELSIVVFLFPLDPKYVLGILHMINHHSICEALIYVTHCGHHIKNLVIAPGEWPDISWTQFVPLSKLFFLELHDITQTPTNAHTLTSMNIRM